MSTRTLKNRKDKLITLFIIGFMSCGAKLPVYVLFVGAFFDQSIAGNILFVIYIFGAILGLIVAKILRLTVFKGEDEPFVMEMPKYRMPSLKMLWFIVYNKALMYLKKAGTFILGASMLIWFLSNYPKIQVDNTLDTNSQKFIKLENSYLGQIGAISKPIFEPLGFDWRLSVAIESGLAAKEVIVATLGVLYNIGDNTDETSSSLIYQIKKNIPFEVAVSFIIFIIIYMPCFAASIVFAKESGGYRYMVYLFLLTSVVAWVASFVGYNFVKLLL
jgi:ferrous iron transport protein B